MSEVDLAWLPAVDAEDDEGLDSARKDGVGLEDRGAAEFGASKIPWVMVLASEGDTVSSDKDKYWASVIDEGAGKMILQASFLGVDAPSVLGNCLRDWIDAASGIDADEAVKEDGVREMEPLSFEKRFLMVEGGLRVSCCERVSSRPI